MILTDEEVEARLTSPENLINKVQIVRIPVGGRKEGDVAIPPMVRGLLANLSITSDESDKAIGAVFGVSQPSVSNSARGLIGDRKDENLAEDVELSKVSVKQKTENAHSLALDSLVQSLMTVAPKIVEAAPSLSIKDLTRTAKDLSNVVANIKKFGSKDGESDTNTVVILHTSDRRKEAAYDVIDV